MQDILPMQIEVRELDPQECRRLRFGGGDVGLGELMRIGWLTKRTKVLGPGWRTAIWLQGCTLGCKGCWNEEMWPTEGGETMGVDEVLQFVINGSETEGVTFLGGEPLQQEDSLLELLLLIRRETEKSVMIYTGYVMEELNETQRACLSLADIVVTGRYIESLRDLGLVWRGSSNQKVTFVTGRYNSAEMVECRQVEIHVSKDGSIVIYGFPDGGDNEWIPIHLNDDGS